MCTLRRNNVRSCRPLSTAIVTHIWNDMRNKTMCYVQHIWKKLNFDNGMKSRVTLSHTRPCSVIVFLRRINTARARIYIMKSVTGKRCNFRYKYIRNCSSTTKMKFTATQKDGWPTINSRRKPVTEVRRMAVPNLNIESMDQSQIQSQRLLICDWLRPESRLVILLTPVFIDKKYLPLHRVTSTGVDV